MSYKLWLLCIISILIRKIREQKAVWEMHIINPLIFIVFSIWTKPTCYQAIDILKFDNILNLVI